MKLSSVFYSDNLRAWLKFKFRTDWTVYVCTYFVAGRQWRLACPSVQRGPVTLRCGTLWWSLAEEWLPTLSLLSARGRSLSLQRGQSTACAAHFYSVKCKVLVCVFSAVHFKPSFILYHFLLPPSSQISTATIKESNHLSWKMSPMLNLLWRAIEI